MYFAQFLPCLCTMNFGVFLLEKKIIQVRREQVDTSSAQLHQIFFPPPSQGENTHSCPHILGFISPGMLSLLATLSLKRAGKRNRVVTVILLDVNMHQSETLFTAHGFHTILEETTGRIQTYKGGVYQIHTGISKQVVMIVILYFKQTRNLGKILNKTKYQYNKHKLRLHFPLPMTVFPLRGMLLESCCCCCCCCC